MGTSTLEKLRSDEAKLLETERQDRAEAVARYRSLVSALAAGKESSKAPAILADIGRTAAQLASDVERYRGRHELLSVAKTSAQVSAERSGAHAELNRFNNVERPEALAKLDERKAILEETARTSDSSVKSATEARRQLLEGAPNELRARVKGLDWKVKQHRGEVSELQCKAHALELGAVQADNHARSKPDRKAEFTKKASEKRAEAKDLLDAAKEIADGPIADVQSEINDVLASAIVPCPELD